MVKKKKSYKKYRMEVNVSALCFIIPVFYVLPPKILTLTLQVKLL